MTIKITVKADIHTYPKGMFQDSFYIKIEGYSSLYIQCDSMDSAMEKAKILQKAFLDIGEEVTYDSEVKVNWNNCIGWE